MQHLRKEKIAAVHPAGRPGIRADAIVRSNFGFVMFLFDTDVLSAPRNVRRFEPTGVPVLNRFLDLQNMA